MIKIKNFLFLLLSLLVLFIIFLNAGTIWERLTSINNPNQTIKIPPSNKYMKQEKYALVKQVNEYVPYNYDDLMNIFYSALNQGWTDFTFFCPVEYKECLKDVAKLSYDKVLLSDINNYVHPYNSYSTIKTLYDDAGSVTLKIMHLYSEEEIEQIDKDINKIIEHLTTNEMSNEEKIKVLHDYIINETKYDTKRANEEKSPYDSERMTGVLYEHYSICSGYADLMAVMLNKLNIPNFKIASKTHVWNAVYLNNQWLHLDLTWDDPVSTSGKDILDHSYFLITNETLKELDNKNKQEHVFNQERYQEIAK